jgi:hypothetical protein
MPLPVAVPRSRAAAGAEPAATPEEAVLHANVCLLGVPESEGAKAGGVVLGRTAFRKPNAKALELILYHAYAAMRGKAITKKARRGAAQGRASELALRPAPACAPAAGGALAAASALRSGPRRRVCGWGCCAVCVPAAASTLAVQRCIAMRLWCDLFASCRRRRRSR